MKSHSPRFAARIGLDWADQKHDICLKAGKQGQLEYGVIQHSPESIADWAKMFYDKKRAEGKSHQATLRMLAFKWIRILFRCWQTNTPYDESAYLFALKKRNAMAA